MSETESPIQVAERQHAELMRRIGDQVPARVKGEIRAAHDDAWCAAHSEGQTCCMDRLLGDL
jgi:hypothetical protein